MQETRKASDDKMVKILGASLKLPESSHWIGSSYVKDILPYSKIYQSIHPSLSKPNLIHQFFSHKSLQTFCFDFPPSTSPFQPPTPNSQLPFTTVGETHGGPRSGPPLETPPPLPSVHKSHVSPLQAIPAIALAHDIRAFSQTTLTTTGCLRWVKPKILENSWFFCFNCYFLP